ncbi:division/cell wall cluster transcriptional repressor MraZ [Candidatus Daviesbacteria bacterium]|nr:division/cell wall cluster transcriptional repressor MraZ [Candidatus Daviesbacteria bacterium]
MFLGEYQLNFSGQGRVVLPKKIREDIGGLEIVLSRGIDGCIWGFGLKGWEEQARAQLEISITDKEGRNLRRYLFSAAEKVRLDRQGRFIVPTPLLNFAGIKDGVVLVGAGDHFELWNISSWKRFKAIMESADE